MRGGKQQIVDTCKSFAGFAQNYPLSDDNICDMIIFSIPGSRKYQTLKGSSRKEESI
jgi:hypothetical protein